MDKIGTERNGMYCNVKVSIWNGVVDDESDQDGLERNLSQQDNILLKMMGGNESD